MNLGFLFSATEGRIGRQQWWLGVIIWAVVYLVISMLILPLIGLGMMPSAAEIQAASNDPTAVTALVMGSVTRSGWVSLVLFLILAYPYYALGVKRRHDRNSNGIDLIVFMVLLALMYLLQGLGLMYGTMDINGVTAPVPSAIGMILPIIVGIFALYLLVVMGFLKGTTGPNQYGPDPVGASIAARTA